MRKPQLVDYLLLTLLSLIWASAFFNIKIATYSFGPVTIGFLRSFLGAIPVLILCFYKNIKIEAFSKDWKWFAIIGLVNLVIPFILISYGVNFVQSNLAAILMSTTPLSSTVLAVCSKTITRRVGSNSLIDFSALLTGSLDNIKFTGLISLYF